MIRRNKYLGVSLICLLIGSFSVFIILSVSSVSNDKIVYGHGEIVFLTFEGGFFGIFSDDGKHYAPSNLPPQFKINGIRVEFIVKILKDQNSFIMWGTIVELLFIRFFF